MLVRVVDATAVSAVLFGDPAADQIVQQLDDAILVAPTVLENHLCEICLQRMHDGEAEESHYLEALGLLQVLDLQVIKQDPGEIVRFAKEYRVSINEAYYLRLAHAFSAELVSLNEAATAPVTLGRVSA